MPIKCYYNQCPRHDNEGPLCYEGRCRASPDDLKKYELERKLKAQGPRPKATTLTSLIWITPTTGGFTKDRGDNMEVLTISQAAELLQVHPETLTKMIDRNQIPAALINRRWRIVKADLMDWLRQQYNKGETTCPTREATT